MRTSIVNLVFMKNRASFCVLMMGNKHLGDEAYTLKPLLQKAFRSLHATDSQLQMNVSISGILTSVEWSSIEIKRFFSTQDNSCCRMVRVINARCTFIILFGYDSDSAVFDALFPTFPIVCRPRMWVPILFGRATLPTGY